MFEISKNNFKNESRKQIKELLLDRMVRVALWAIIGIVFSIVAPQMSLVAIGICGMMAMVHLIIGIVILPIAAFDRHMKYRKFLNRK